MNYGKKFGVCWEGEKVNHCCLYLFALITTAFLLKWKSTDIFKNVLAY